MLANRVIMGSGGSSGVIPGPDRLLGGDMEAGYFGQVPVSELFTGIEIANKVGITQGTSEFNNVGWLKFAIDGKVIFKSQKIIRDRVSWENLDEKGCVYGGKEVEKDGVHYKVRLMKGANKDPSGGIDGKVNHESEWNKLMLPIHERAKDQSWKYKDNVKTPVEYWNINLTDDDLHLSGVNQYCQEATDSAGVYRLIRGKNGVSDSKSGFPTSTYNVGWSPVLEVISDDYIPSYTADEVVEMIGNLAWANAITLSDEADVRKVANAYLGLSSSEKNNVNNLNGLNNRIDKLRELGVDIDNV